MLILSFLNLWYTFGSKPMNSKKENNLNLFNEACIYVVCLFMYMHLNAIADSDYNKLGWVLIIATFVNIGGNLSLVFLESVLDIYENFKVKKATEKVQNIFNLRRTQHKRLEQHQL